MPQTHPHDLHRFLTFIDACIAIAVTLLVLPLVDAAGEARSSQSLGHFLREHESLFFSFLLSFVVIARLWTAHHRYMRHVAESDEAVVRWVLAWTLCLVLIPVPNALISSFDSRSGVVPLYIGLLLASAICSSGLAVHVSRHPELLYDGVGAAEVSPVPAMAMVACYTGALALGTAVAAVNFYALLLLVLADPLTTRWNAWRARSGRGA